VCCCGCDGAQLVPLIATPAQLQGVSGRTAAFFATVRALGIAADVLTNLVLSTTQA
jgi:hypothetical protein